MHNGTEIRKILKKTANTSFNKLDPYKKDVILSEEGQWRYPGQVTKIPSGDITMKGVGYPVLGVDDLGNQKIMHPGMDYTFPGQYVTEYPQMHKMPDGSMMANDQMQTAKYGGSKDITCSSCNWSWDKKDSAKSDLYVCHKCGHDNSSKMQKGGWLDKYATGDSSPEKAQAMLEDGTAHGHPLAQRQIDFFTSLLPEEEQNATEEFKRGGQKYLRVLSRNSTNRNILTMKKQDILKQYGLTEEAFYTLCKAMGGIHKLQKGGSKEYDKKKFVAPTKGAKVTAPGEGFELMEGQDPAAAKTYYDKMIAEAKPGNLGSKQPTTPDEKLKYKQWLISQVESGVSPEQLIDKKFATLDMLPELQKNYQAQYIDKEKQLEKPKQLDLGIGWHGERNEVFGSSLPKYKDESGKEILLQQYKIPAQWDEKTKTWNTGSGYNQPTVITGYQKDGKWKTFDPESKLSSEGEGAKTKVWYTKEGLKYPSYVQGDEDQKVMTSGALTVSGATAMDVQNSGMNYNANKDVIAPINTRASGKGIGQDKSINTFGVTNLHANTGMPYKKNGGASNILTQWAPDFFNPEYLMQEGGAMSTNMQGQYPNFNYGGPDQMQMGGDPAISMLNSNDSLKVFQSLVKKATGGKTGPAYPGQTQENILGQKKNEFMDYLRNSTMNALAKEENDRMQYEMMDRMQYGGNQPMQNQPFSQYVDLSPGPFGQAGYNPNMNNQNAFLNASNQGLRRRRQDFNNFSGATQNMLESMNTSYVQAQDGIQVTGGYEDVQKRMAEYYAAKEKETTDKNKSGYKTGDRNQGMNYFPTNFNPFYQISKKEDEQLKKLIGNPNTFLQEYDSKNGFMGRALGLGPKRVHMKFRTYTDPVTGETKQAPVQKPIMKGIAAPTVVPKESNVMKGQPTINTQFNPNFSWDKAFQFGGFNNPYDDNQTSYIQYDEQGNPITADRQFGHGKKPAGPRFADPNIAKPQQPGFTDTDVNLKRKTNVDGESAANWAISGMGAISSMFEAEDAKKNQEMYQSMQGADNQFYSQTAGNRGDHDQFGNFRPNQKVLSKFGGQNTNGQSGSNYQFQEGGVYYLTDDQISSIMQAGGQIDFLD